MVLTSANLSALPYVAHGFFTRQGGVSTGIYASLNSGGRDSFDDPVHIAENRRHIAATLGASTERLLSLYQVHGSQVITVTKPWAKDALPSADAMVTKAPGLALGILTADCVPVLFADTQSSIIGAAHAGWKGTLAGVLERTLEAMMALGAKRETVVAAIGPAIAQASYEVGDELRRKLPGRYFIASFRPGYWRFDLKALVRDILTESGIHTVNMLENDTYLEEDAFFSYRRATHRKEPDYGRQLSAIMLKPVT